MASIARLLANLRPAFRFVAPSVGVAPTGTAHAPHDVNVDDADRLRTFEIERVRRNPATLISPRF